MKDAILQTDNRRVLVVSDRAGASDASVGESDGSDSSRAGSEATVGPTLTSERQPVSSLEQLFLPKEFFYSGNPSSNFIDSMTSLTTEDGDRNKVMASVDDGGDEELKGGSTACSSVNDAGADTEQAKEDIKHSSNVDDTETKTKVEVNDDDESDMDPKGSMTIVSATYGGDFQPATDQNLTTMPTNSFAQAVGLTQNEYTAPESATMASLATLDITDSADTAWVKKDPFVNATKSVPNGIANSPRRSFKSEVDDLNGEGYRCSEISNTLLTFVPHRVSYARQRRAYR